MRSVSTITAKNRCACWIATWFGVGFIKVAPGTAATLAALPAHWGLQTLPMPLHIAAIMALAAAGVWSAGKIAGLLADNDPQIVVVDEVAGALLALSFLRNESFLFELIAILLFRAFDILKPWPIGAAGKCKPVGLGIMVDDILAGTIAGLAVRLV